MEPITITAIGNAVSGAFNSITNGIKGIFTVTETGKTNRTQLQTDAQKYGDTTSYAQTLVSQQNNTVKIFAISFTIIVLGLLTFNIFKKR